MNNEIKKRHNGDFNVENLLKEKKELENKLKINFKNLNDYCISLIQKELKKGIKKRFLSEVLEINNTNFSSVLNGKRNFTEGQINKIIKILNK
jgi:hypothetical protein